MKEITKAIEKAKFTTRVNSDEAQITIGVDGYFYTKSELIELLSLVAKKQRDVLLNTFFDNPGDMLYTEDKLRIGLKTEAINEIRLITDNLK